MLRAGCRGEQSHSFITAALRYPILCKVKAFRVFILVGLEISSYDFVVMVVEVKGCSEFSPLGTRETTGQKAGYWSVVLKYMPSSSSSPAVDTISQYRYNIPPSATNPLMRGFVLLAHKLFFTVPIERFHLAPG